MMAASKKEEEQFAGDEGCASKEDIVVKILPIENIVKDIKTVYTEETAKTINGDNSLLATQEESDKGLKPLFAMNSTNDSMGSVFLTKPIFSTTTNSEAIVSAASTFPEISSISYVNPNPCTLPGTVETITTTVTTMSTASLSNTDSGETNSRDLSQPVIMATAEESGLSIFGNNCDSLFSKSHSGYSDRMGTGVVENAPDERKSNGENNNCNVSQLPALKAIENMAVAASSLQNASMISKTSVPIISNERHDELTTDTSVKPLVFSVSPTKSMKDYLDKIIETKTSDTDIVTKLCIAETEKPASKSSSAFTPSEDNVDSVKEMGSSSSQCDLTGNKDSRDSMVIDHVNTEKQASHKIELSNSLVSVSLLTSSSLSSPPVLQHQSLGLSASSSLLLLPPLPEHSESQIPTLQQETQLQVQETCNDQEIVDSEKQIVHEVSEAPVLVSSNAIISNDATSNINVQLPAVISRSENSLGSSEFDANVPTPSTPPPSLTPALQSPSLDILQNSGQVSKPTPKARKSGPPANQSNYYVKTVNLAPIANIRVKLPVMEKSFSAKPGSPPPTATTLKMNKINTKNDSDKEDQNLSFSDSEKNKLNKNIRPRKRRWGTYDLPNKKRKKKRSNENDNAGGDDMYDDDDDDDEDTSRDGDDINDKNSLEPMETDNKRSYNASSMLKNSTILELLTKQSHAVSKDENSGPILPHLRRNKVQTLHRKVPIKSGHTGKTVAELLRESQAKQLAAKEFHNTNVVHQSAPFLHKDTEKIIEIQHKLDDSGKENTGNKLELKKDEGSQKKSISGTSVALDRHSNKKKLPVFQGLQSILPKPPGLSPKPSLNKTSPKKFVTTVPAIPTSITITTSCRTLPNPPTMPISVVMTSEGAKVSLLSQMVAATSKFPATTTLSSPGLRSLLGPNGVSLPVTPPKTPENNQTPTPAPTPPAAKVMKKTSMKAAHPRSTAPSDRDVIPLCCCKINGAAFKKLPTVTYCQALDSIDGKVMGCCNKVTNNQLVRSAVKIPFMAVCEFHRQSLKQHQCCPGCGHFCMQGRFYQCRKEGGSVIHNFHKQCQVFRDNKYYCPHCGEESSQYEVTLTLNEPRMPSSLKEKEKSQPEPPVPPPSRAKLAIHTRTYRALEKLDSKGKVAPEDAKTFTFKSTGSSSNASFSSDGIPIGEDKEFLEKCFSTLEQDRPKKYRSLPKSLYGPCKDGDLTKVIYMLVDGADPNKSDPDNEDQTAVHAAAIGGHLAILHVLIQAGGNIHTVDGRLNNALMYACEHNHMEMVRYLVQAGSFLDVKGEDGMTCLHMAAKGGHIQLMEFLLNTRKVDVNVQDDGGWTPIIWAAEHRNVDTVKFLISHGADPTLKDNEENTGLHWAAFSGSVEIAEIFLNHGCELESPNEHGDRPLHIAARQDNYKCVVLCLVRGADVEGRNNVNQMPIDCCLDQKSHVWMALKVNKQLKGLAAKRLERQEKLVHRDVSFGRENFPITSVNIVDDEGPPLDFQYVTQSVETTPLSINRVISSLQSCSCKDNCSSTFCVCSRSSVKCWYDQMGRLVQEFNQLEPPYIFECNRNCRCWTSCNNRVVQNGIVCRLQLFKTKGRGWGVKTLRDIPQGSFICEYIGELISDSEADRREDDSYLFDLDNKDGETYCIDARRYGNISRFINHLCEPNVIPVKVFVDHQDMRFPRICFFASRDVKAGEELGFDYGEKFWVIKWKQFTCACGSPKCKYSADTIRQTLEDYRLRHGDDDSPENL